MHYFCHNSYTHITSLTFYTVDVNHLFNLINAFNFCHLNASNKSTINNDVYIKTPFTQLRVVTSSSKQLLRYQLLAYTKPMCLQSLVRVATDVAAPVPHKENKIIMCDLDAIMIITLYSHRLAN